MPLDANWKSGSRRLTADALTATDMAYFGSELREKIIHPLTERMLDFWMERAGQDMPPRRDAFDPVDLRPWIGNLSIWDYIAGTGSYICRIYGSRLVERLGKELTNLPVEQYPMGLAPSILGQFELTRTLAQPVLIEVTDPVMPESYAGRTNLRIEKLILPLTRAGKTVDCVLNWYVYTGEDLL